MTFDDEVEYFQYWFMVCGIMVWIPTSIMLVSYVIIWFKLRHSLKAFPYLSIQSRVARSRRKIIHMLLILFLLELVCWAPWQFYLVFDYHVWKSKHDGIPREDVRNTLCLWDTFPWFFWISVCVLGWRSCTHLKRCQVLHDLFEQCRQSNSLWIW